MSLRVGLGASQADLDVQGEIDFDFFEESDCSININKTSSALDSCHTSPSTEVKSECAEDHRSNHNVNLKEPDLHLVNVPESCSSKYFNKPVITVSCDDATGLVQKTTIETVIPTPFNYKDNKCGKASPSGSRKMKKLLSPRLKSKIFSDDYEISDDSSISSMSESESDLSSVSDDSFELNDESDSMTDVSPLMSPFQCSSPKPGGTSQRTPETQRTSKESPKEGVKFLDSVDKKECPKCEAIDINELLRAVKRLEMGQNINHVCKEKCVSPSANTHEIKCRRNMSFSNEEVRRIDNDNQVLLKKIVAQQHRMKPRPASTMRVVSSSAVNRHRHQRQIELENLALLKRLESTKASRDLSRLHLLRDYDRKSPGVLSRASSRSSKPCSAHGSSLRTSNSSGRSSAISIKSSNSSAMRSVSSVNKP